MKKQNSIKQNLGGEKSLFCRASAEEFEKIPGSPIAYWVNQRIREVFKNSRLLGEIAEVKTGMTTADNDKFVRLWHEVSIAKAGFNIINSQHALESRKKWFPYNKGGGFRRWYGFNGSFVNWELDGNTLKSNVDKSGKRRASVRAEKYYFLPSITYSAVTSAKFSARISPKGFLFDSGGSSVFCSSERHNQLVSGLLCSPLPEYFLAIYNSTLNFQPGDVCRIPVKDIPSSMNEDVRKIVQAAFLESQKDWDSFETSWDFTTLPILQLDHHLPTISDTYSSLRNHWLKNILEMQRLEEENNRIFIEAYGLQDELMPEVPLSEITLTCNPHYRYKGNKTEAELEALLLADTMIEFISYAVGCMFGRYSLDRPGLILANQGETIEDYMGQIPSPTFSADDDNVIPILDGDWFSDDVTERFFKFLRLTFGEEHYEENLQFIENAIGKSIRKYFLKDFYNDHVRRYKKRPIYWMFSSPKGSFNVLIYMHRYRPDTVSVILNVYLREFRAKLNAKLTHLEKVGIGFDSSKSEKAKAIKESEKLKKIITEVDDYERDVLYPLATEQVEIDLDDGVKVNYNKFGTALKKITGLTEKGK